VKLKGKSDSEQQFYIGIDSQGGSNLTLVKGQIMLNRSRLLSCKTSIKSHNLKSVSARLMVPSTIRMSEVGGQVCQRPVPVERLGMETTTNGKQAFERTFVVMANAELMHCNAYTPRLSC
jgi:hypothetical protein